MIEKTVTYKKHSFSYDIYEIKTEYQDNDKLLEFLSKIINCLVKKFLKDFVDL